ncbi:hypothetical protein J7T55_014425 [Diaporthe amygdali]|uniref:uncharacterized protein n=1 Tax=Phomopsis amygdali TaxID=1214568 RepID=UPI0022FE024A|nr:uncharacterized protein J7T55_014425 [Diaporthe amygdali]KAJ0117974.1 hypothetical protein J7T55_014425 [Diaporthe amygdali]
MVLFFKDDPAKARRTQEREEQQKKKTVKPAPYNHTPTHALSDALLSVPHAYKTTDKERLKEAHKHRLEKEASAFAAGVDCNVTNIPAKYWQGQPLPSVFKAPSQGTLAKSAISKAWKEKIFERPLVSRLKKQPQAPVPVDEGYASGPSHDKPGESRNYRTNTSTSPCFEQGTERQHQVQALKGDEKAELEHLRRIVRELETLHDSSNPLVAQGQNPAPGANVGVESGTGSGSGSSDAVRCLESDFSNKKKNEPTPSTSISTREGTVLTGVDRYDWAIHWAPAEQKANLPEPWNPPEPRDTAPKNEPCYDSLGELSSWSDSSSTARNSDYLRRRSNETPKPSEPSIHKTSESIGRSRPRKSRRKATYAPSDSALSEFDFGFGPATTPVRQFLTPKPGSYLSETRRRADKAAATKYYPSSEDSDRSEETLITF